MKKININKDWLVQELEIKTVKEIARDLKISPYTLRRKIKEYGILSYRTKNKQISLPTKNILEEELKKYSIKELSKKYNVCIEYFRIYIKNLGIKRSRHAHLINHDYFKTISKNSAYILGFLFADGSINKNKIHNYLKIELNTKDVEVLEFIKNEIQPSLKIKHCKRKHKKTKKIYESAILSISSNILTNDLISLGCVPNKTKEEIAVPDIPKEFYPDFIRGVFDGDGSIYITKDEKKYGCYICCSSISFLREIQFIIGFGKISVSDWPFRINFCSKKDIQSFFNYIYNNEFCLKRKFEKFKTILIKKGITST